jgi:cytochrome c oxidase assembly factor CtaG
MELGMPDRFRPLLARVVDSSKRRGVFGTIIRLVTNPVVDLIYFNLVMWMWFYPPMMTFAVDNKYVMLVMHYTFITSGMLLFTQLIDSPPYRSRVSNPVWRLGMVLVSTYSSWMLAMLMGLTHHPWFPVYFHIPGKTMSPMTDQQIGASILWVLCMEPFLYTAYYCIKLWLTMSEESRFPEVMRPWMKNVRKVKSEHELLDGGTNGSAVVESPSIDGVESYIPKEIR